jgi:hypothetical protein
MMLLALPAGVPADAFDRRLPLFGVPTYSSWSLSCSPC